MIQKFLLFTIIKESQRHVRWLFSHPCTFVTSIYNLKDLPEGQRPELAFAGRSNVGKSSLINFIFQNKDLARTSNTPGRTQCLNFFQMDKIVYVVDMPGYGYAHPPKRVVENWNKILRTYLQGRVQLKRVFLLIDSRHGLKKNDHEIMDMLDEAAVVYQVILTKIDKISKLDLTKRYKEFDHQFKKHPAFYPKILSSSSEKKIGLDELQKTIAFLVNK